MQKIPVSELKAGMVIAKAIMNESGMVLLGEGTALTHSIISRLKRMDLNSIFVEGALITGKSREEMLSDLDSRFKKTEKEPHMELIKGIIRDRIVEVYK